MSTFRIIIATILLISIFYNIFYTTKEGLECNYEDKGTGVNPSNSTCNNTTIYENEEKNKEAEEKLNELKKMVAETKASITKNTTSIQKNSKNITSMNNVAQGKDVDTGDACKKYPEAC